jgi:DNA polymerase II large subunit
MQKKYVVKKKLTGEIVDTYYVLSYALMRVKPDEELIEIVYDNND